MLMNVDDGEVSGEVGNQGAAHWNLGKLGKEQ